MPTKQLKTYLVTGASSGIGLDIVRLLTARGHRIIATGRRGKADLPADFPDLEYLPADLGSEADRARIIDRLPGVLNRAILAAGVGHYRPLSKENASDIRRTVNINLTANVCLAHALHAPLAKAGGRLGFVGSTAYRGASTMPIYAASKAAIDGFARSLAIEWSGKIVVKALHPGPTATGMSVRAGRPADLLDRLMLPSPRAASALIAALEKDGGFRRIVSYASVWKRAILAGNAA